MNAEQTQSPINPYYARRNQPTTPNHRIASTQAPQCGASPRPYGSSARHVRFAKLPAAPVTASPVPHLTSLYHLDEGYEFGDRSYPGNCSGSLIRDLLNYFRPRDVFDPMSGSGTCRQVCEALGVPCVAGDIHEDFDAAHPTLVDQLGGRQFEFIWAHPPYWRQKLYAADARDLSRAPTLDAFLERYAAFITNCTKLLARGGKLAILMGDYTDRQSGFVPLTYHTKRLAFAAGLRQCCTDIIRFSHGAGSSRKVYRSAFIPGLHDVCMVFSLTCC
ncbi:MAG: hypothetical protein JNG88_09325 [Phycisphaerales bacterium]|nr:hypothetical protein [Phycisphaerales bacterium]